MKTKKDLYIQFHNETGNEVRDDLFDRYKQQYYDWLEERYLERINEEEAINNLFSQNIDEELKEYDQN